MSMVVFRLLAVYQGQHAGQGAWRGPINPDGSRASKRAGESCITRDQAGKSISSTYVSWNCSSEERETCRVFSRMAENSSGWRSQ